MTDVTRQNVYGKPLHSHAPKVGVSRDGFCASPDSDSGNHSIAATVTSAFLDFSAGKGNDLREAAGLVDGAKWCLCATRWKEAFDAKDGDDDAKVPRVRLDATGKRALDVIGFKDLKAFAQEGAISSVIDPKSGMGGDKVREAQNIGATKDHKGREQA